MPSSALAVVDDVQQAARVVRLETAAGEPQPGAELRPTARPPASGRTRSARRAPARGSPRARRPRARSRPAASRSGSSPCWASEKNAGSTMRLARSPVAPNSTKTTASSSATPLLCPTDLAREPKVREGGLEPPRPRAPEPKSDAAASYATPAWTKPTGWCIRPCGGVATYASCRVHAGWGESRVHVRAQRTGGAAGRRRPGGRRAGHRADHRGRAGVRPPPADHRPGGRHGHRDGRGQLPHRRLGRDGHRGPAAVPHPPGRPDPAAVRHRRRRLPGRHRAGPAGRRLPGRPLAAAQDRVHVRVRPVRA